MELVYACIVLIVLTVLITGFLTWHAGRHRAVAGSGSPQHSPPRAAGDPLIQSVGHGLLVLDETGTLTHLNPAAAQILNTTDYSVGLSAEAAIARWPQLADCWQGAGETYTEIQLDSLDGTRWVDARVSFLYSDQGCYQGRVIALWDITRRKQSEEVLRASDDQLKAVFNKAALGLVITDSQGNFVDCNSAYLEMLGYEKEDLLHKHYSDYTYPDDTKASIDLQQQISDRLIEWYQLEKRYVRKDGSLIWVRVTASAIHDDAGRPKYGIAVVEDISKRKQAEEELKLDEIRLATQVELNNMADATEAEIFNFALENSVKITGSRSGIILLVNEEESMVTLLTVSQEVMTGNHAKWPPCFDIRSGGLWTEVFRTRQPVVVNDYASDINGKKGLPEGHMKITRLLEIPLIDNGRIMALCVVANKETDYTDADSRHLALLMNGLWRIIARKRAENEVIEAKAQAELYLDLMGHDISNLHQIALGYLEIVRDMYLEEGQADILDKPVEVLQRSARLIENVRKIQKIQADSFPVEKIDVAKVLADIQAECGSMPNSKVSFIYNSTGPCLVPANDLLYDVFSNLVINAIKHSNGHCVDVLVDLDSVRDNGKPYYRVMVEDYGPGIPDDFKDKIFNRQLRGTTKAKGMGLGLYLVKSLVELYNGRVWVEDRICGDYTKGAKFVVLLPAVEA